MQQTQQHFSATEYELQQQQPQYLGKHDAAVKYMQQLGLHKQNIKVDSEASTLPIPVFVNKHFSVLHRATSCVSGFLFPT